MPQDYPFYQIYTQPLAGGEPQLISTGRGRTTCSYFSPDGKHDSVRLEPSRSAARRRPKTAERKQQAEDAKTGVRRRYQWDFDPHTDIFEADLDGKNLKPLTDARATTPKGPTRPTAS